MVKGGYFIFWLFILVKMQEEDKYYLWCPIEPPTPTDRINDFSGHCLIQENNLTKIKVNITNRTLTNNIVKTTNICKNVIALTEKNSINCFCEYESFVFNFDEQKKKF